MKKVVWKNKSNNQLCITIPKNSGLKEGDLVEIKRNSIKHIAYSGMVADLFHFGHLQSLLFSKSIADYNVVGVLTDEAVEEYRARPIANLQERKAVLEALSCVDRVVIQHSRDHTENLQKIHKEFPAAEIILVHGDNIKNLPGITYLESIGGRVVQHPYYPKLSTFRILQQFQQRIGKLKDIKEFTSFFHGQDDSDKIDSSKTIISSKADTLKALQPQLTQSCIESLYSFTISDWKNDKARILQTLAAQFSPSKIVVRSSSVSEDNLERSNAGFFESILEVDSSSIEKIESAVKSVLQSYKEKNAETSFNQVLVQKQTEHLVMSGVVFTRTLEKNAPYYVINYDDATGSTDSITAGKEGKTTIISHSANSIPEPLQPLMAAVKELENIIPSLPLDIEFAITQEGQIVIFQVRPLAANIHRENRDSEVNRELELLKNKFKDLAAKPAHLCAQTTFFADMPDWNPAEIIGDRPNHLDYSLYDYLITNSAWHEARASQSYFNVNPAKLVELFANKPYVNVRNTFNSFTPSSISPPLREKLVNFYLEKLRANPSLQDKVEFEIIYTCYDLNFEIKSSELAQAGFSMQEIIELKDSLVNLTNHLLSSAQKTIDEDMKTVLSMEESRKFIIARVKAGPHSPKELINYSKILLDECRSKGTVQFSRLARLGFIGKIILKSMVQQNIVSQEFYDSFYASVSTIATKINEDFKRLIRGNLSKEQFVQEYYHLRPGTYDITSPRYESHPELINTINLDIKEESKGSFALEKEASKSITAALCHQGLKIQAEEFLHFVEKATQARELSKFEFTKNLSDALELIAAAGEEMGFTRKEIALLDINDIFRTSVGKEVYEITQYWKDLITKKDKKKQIQDKLVLPALIFSELDFDIVQHYQAKPNFITQKSIESKAVYLNEIAQREIPDLENSIVVLENGDPGYDWIFTRNIVGLVTKYGGVASHMSIRCAEFGLPAAIGCGEIIFNQIKNAEKILLDCKANKIIPRR